mmetsp:Transcript_27735/g.89279  ORF Transcript_27735/g.89279 Transcript_27735/m.89279 type:complete len:330 (+) Transcript_27735:731-1720(+)
MSLALLTLALLVPLLLLFRRKSRKMPVRGRWVLITGGGSGIGAELALELARRGAKLVLWDIHEGGLRQVREEILSLTPSAAVVCRKVDVSDATAVRAAAAELGSDALGAGQHVAYLVNNAGIVYGQGVVGCDEARVARTINVNLLAHFWTTRALLPPMLEHNDGLVVTVSSLMGMIGGARLADYCASKWGALGMHESLTLEVRRAGRPGVSTLAVCPYAARTGMFSGIFESDRHLALLRWLFPLLSPAALAVAIADAMERREAWLVVPRLHKWVALIIHLLPAPLYYSVLELMGGRYGMDTFRGRGAAWNDGASSRRRGEGTGREPTRS